MPDPPASFRVQAKRAISEQVIAFTVPAIKIRRGRAGAHKYQAALLVHAGATPVIRCAGPLPTIALPGLMAEFAGTRNGVKAPEFLASAHIKRARVAGRR